MVIFELSYFESLSKKNECLINIIITVLKHYACSWKQIRVIFPCGLNRLLKLFWLFPACFRKIHILI